MNEERRNKMVAAVTATIQRWCAETGNPYPPDSHATIIEYLNRDKDQLCPECDQRNEYENRHAAQRAMLALDEAYEAEGLPSPIADFSTRNAVIVLSGGKPLIDKRSRSDASVLWEGELTHTPWPACPSWCQEHVWNYDLIHSVDVGSVIATHGHSLFPDEHLVVAVEQAWHKENSYDDEIDDEMEVAETYVYVTRRSPFHDPEPVANFSTRQEIEQLVALLKKAAKQLEAAEAEFPAGPLPSNGADVASVPDVDEESR